MSRLNQKHFQIIMGGSQSTGSSLLVNILNRHSEISSGPETYLFMHPKLYENWENNKRYLIRTNKFGGLKSRTWFKFNGAKLNLDFYGWKEAELKELIFESTDFRVFVNRYMARSMKENNAKIWIEKSPSNTMAFPEFLKYFSSSKIIHTYRNPYDVVASLVNRGYSYYAAAGSYILDTALALRVYESENCYSVAYENLVNHPDKTVAKLLDFLNLEMQPNILEPKENEKALNIKMKGWKNNEKGTIQKSSLNRFDQEDEETREKIKVALQSFEIKSGYAKKYQIKQTTIQEITKVLGYEFKPSNNLNKSGLTREKREDQFKRFIKLYPAYSKNYPGKLRG